MSKNKFRKELLYHLRNHVPWKDLLDELKWPHKLRDSRRCFLCPKCGEYLAVVNPRTNLGRCFRCQRNFNPIDLVMVVWNCDFLTAVYFLEENFPPPPPTSAGALG
jgi:hypothetical protein